MSRLPLLLLPLLPLLACHTNEIKSAMHGGRVDVGLDAPPRTAVLQFEAKKPGARALPFPFVDAQVNGQATRLLVDSGATGHTLDRSLANNVADTSVITVDGWGPLKAQPVTAVDLPEPVRARGIGGVISPSLLAKVTPPKQALVVDFVRSQMRSQERAAARASVEELGVAISPAAKACSNGLVTIEATVDGAPAKLVADTLTSRSYLNEKSPAGDKAAGHPFLGRSITYSRMAEVPLSLYGGVAVTAGSWSHNADIGVGIAPADDGCGAQGHVGMDALQRCALVFAGDDLVLGCRPAASR